MKKRCTCGLMIVDVQNDFCRGGSLAVPDGDAVVPPLNRLIRAGKDAGINIYATRCQHPEETIHFKKWPSHCVDGTRGFRFHPKLKLPKRSTRFWIISKGTRPDEDAYDAFEGFWNGLSTHALVRKLHEVKKLYVAGLATDYCVKATVLKARQLKYEVVVVSDACRAVNIKSGDRAIQEMKDAGAVFLTSEEVLNELRK